MLANQYLMQNLEAAIRNPQAYATLPTHDLKSEDALGSKLP